MAKGANTKTIFFWILMALNIIAGVPLLLAFFAGFTPPSFSRVIFCASIGFLYLLVANFVMIVAWFFINYRFALISVFLILLNINNIDRHFQFNATDVPEKVPGAIKVMSYNAQLFGLYTDSDMDKRRADNSKVMAYLREENPDIVCFQEYFWDKSESLNFHKTDTILTILGLDDNENYYYQYFPDTLRNAYYYGLAIFSRYRIVNTGVVPTDSSSNAIIFIDFKFRSDTIRLYNAHLASLHMNATDYETSRQVTNNEYTDPAFDKNAKRLLRKLTDASVKREKQVDSLRKHIDESPYPVIVCGDFNDTPASYCYNKVAHNLKDVFRESGHGFGYTYHGANMPHYRIDCILHDKKYISFGYTVGTQLKVSDHYPVHATISLQKRL